MCLCVQHVQLCACLYRDHLESNSRFVSEGHWVQPGTKKTEFLQSSVEILYMDESSIFNIQ